MKVIDGQRGKHCSEAEYLTYTHKRCGSCGKIKTVEHFYRMNTTTKRGWAWSSRCKECNRQQCSDYAVGSRDKRNARLRDWRRNNPEATKQLDRRRHLRQKYDLTPEEFDQMVADQDGKCALCGKECSRLFVDHSHDDGHVRDLLCPGCNTMLGWYETNAETILKFQGYIKRHSATARSRRVS